MPNLLKNPIGFSRCFFAWLDTLARHRLLAIVFIACLSFGGSWFFSAFRGIPVPYIHDEFSYLLASDTFAHGRITNPTHPMWQYFETFHVLQNPSYMSIFPPGQGFFLALGQVLLGHPIYGVWLSTGLMCAAICWMLYAWFSPRWALVGGLVAVLQFGIFTYWSQSYWGGAVAGMGGALIFGALPRIFKYQHWRDALLLGLGIGMLVNTRPLEGIVFTIPLGCLVLPWKIRWQALDKRRLIKHVLLPLSLMMIAIALLTGAYNKKITGNASVLPHLLYSKQYLTVPTIILQPLHWSTNYNPEFIKNYAKKYSVNYYLQKRTWQGLAQSLYADGIRLCMFFFGFPLALPSLPILIILFCNPRTSGRYCIAFCVILLMMGALTSPCKPHYAASLTCFAILMITIGLKGLYWLNIRQKRIGPAIILLLTAFQLLLNITLTPVQPAVRALAQSIPSPGINLPRQFSREELKNILIKRGGKYLVIVQYPPWHNYLLEWVNNDADIDHSPVVWARNMGAAGDVKLLNYFKDRQVLFIKIVWEMKLFIFSYTDRQ